MFKKSILAFLVGVLLLYCGCSTPRTKPSTPADQIFPTKNTYQKTGILISNKMESTPFEWNGELYYLLTNRSDSPGDSRLQIIKFQNNQVISNFGNGFSLASALVWNNKLYVFATKGSIYMFESSDLINFNNPIKVLDHYHGQLFYNTSVTYNQNTSEFVLAYETNEFTPFSIRFLKSPDLINWTPTGNVFGQNRYVACPTIRFINGFYYMWYLADEAGYFITRLTRSSDLVNWEESRYVFMIPASDENMNNSDVDLTFYNGTTYIFYAIGDQQTYAGIRYATWSGDIESLVLQYF